MAKGYWIARMDVHDQDAYKTYLSLNGKAFAKFGARFLARAGTHEAVEGTARARNVIIEFPSYRAALDCYRSPEYADAMAARTSASEGELLIIEGYEGTQPGD